MSNRALTWAFDQDIQPSGAKFVLVALADHANEAGYCYPSQARLAFDTGQTDRAVRTHLATLEERGILVRERRNDEHGHRKSDGFWLVGYKPLPESVSARLPEESAARLPEDISGRPTPPTGNKRQSLPENSSGLYKGEPPVDPPVVVVPTSQRHAATPKKHRREPLNQGELFEAIASCWRPRWRETNLTKSERSLIGMVATELDAIGACPEHVASAWKAMPRIFPKLQGTWTPAALAKHWGELTASVDRSELPYNPETHEEWRTPNGAVVYVKR